VAIPEAGSPLAGGGAPGAPGQRKVARFIAADAAQSALALAPDGQLPTLTLVDTAKVEKDPNEGSSINPLFLIIGGAISVCLSVVLLFADLGGEGSDPGEDRVRQQLELYYKGQREPLAAYQSRLRQAQQAYSRGDRKTANQNYRKVLELLRSEGANRFGGLTGTPSGDKRLEELLSRMLSQDYSPEAPEEQ
jgi:predicted lipid-binding transport protein (Tim44 family)